LVSRSVAAEDIGFPFAAQAARLIRQHRGRKDERVGLITDLTADQLPASQWLQANRQGWGIENGTHQRLDVSLNDDRCRVRNTNGLLILGMLRRLVISLFMHWRLHQPRPHHQSHTDFQAAMGEDNLTKATAFVTCRRPKL
jgi:predicted transposase YbfD/YdcC